MKEWDFLNVFFCIFFLINVDHVLPFKQRRNFFSLQKYILEKNVKQAVSNH